MNIKQILKRKGEEVFALRPDSPVREFAALVARQGIGAAPVTDCNGGLAGVVSERDVTRAFAARGAAIAESPVAELMTSSVVSCTPENSVSDVVDLMHQNSIRHLPVVEDGVLVGFLSIRDVVFSRLNEIELDNMALREMLENYDTIG